MTKALVLGSGGLLGSHLIRYFGAVGTTRDECNILSPTDINKAIRIHRPDVIINCAGIVPKSPQIADMEHVYRVNAFGPRIIADQCDKAGVRLIHISTDCVYNGARGGYTESDFPSPMDVYGMSKLLGEITHYPHLTLRTSFIGLPDPTGRGLLAWASRERRVIGYDKVLWNGLTTFELGNIIFGKLLDVWSHTGLLHIHGEALTKLDVLVMAAAVWGWNLAVTPESNTTSFPHRADKTLNSNFLKYQSEKPLFVQLKELRYADAQFG